MYMNTLAFAYALDPPSAFSHDRTLKCTVLFAAAAVVGWPFSLAVAVPFVIEEFFICGADIIQPDEWYKWWFSRVMRLIASSGCAALLFVCFFFFEFLNEYKM